MHAAVSTAAPHVVRSEEPSLLDRMDRLRDEFSRICEMLREQSRLVENLMLRANGERR